MKATLEIEVDIDTEATEEQVKEFLRFEFHYGGGCSSDNPCLDADYEVNDFHCRIL